MSVKFKALQKRNPLAPEEPRKFYAQVVHTNEISLRQLSRDIAASSTWSSSETYGMLEELLQRIGRYVADGTIVRLGEMGSFSITINSEGSGTAEEVSAGNIKTRRLLFRPGKEMRRILSEIEFIKE